MSPLVGQIALGVYAILLGVGGVIGFVKARSRPSLIAGLVSAVVALIGLALTTQGNGGFLLGIALSAVMLVVFGVRFGRSRKFMPAGMLGLVSLAVLVLLAIVVAMPRA
jgi:uncharacterized membrane protein (UPF0136 family)